MSSEQTPASAASDWQRLSVVSIIYFVIKFTVLAVKRWFINLIPAVAAVSFFSDNKFLLISIISPIVVLLITAFSILYYWHFKFRIEDGKILVHRGVLNKEHLNLEFARIQNVNIVSPLYFSPFKVVNCTIESAGSKGAEVELPGVKETIALALRTDVFASEKEVAKTEQANETSNPPGPFLKLSNWETAKSGLTSYLAFVLVAAIAPFGGRIESYLSKSIIPTLMGILEPLVGNKIVAGIMILIGFALLYFFLITTASMLGALIRYYNYELHDNEDKLLRVAGLFERKSTTLKKSKVQSIAITQNVVARLLGRIQLQYRQVGVKQSNDSDSSIRIPILRSEEKQKHVSVVFEDCPEPEFARIHSSYLLRVFVFFFLGPIVAGVSILSIFLGKFALLGLLALIPAFLLIRLRFLRYGFWFNDEYAAIRQGMFGQAITVFPMSKAQLTRVGQSYGQRKRNLGNLTFQLGSGTVSIPYLPMESLNRFTNLTLYKVESSAKPWM